jgi:MFS family permease
MGPTIAIGVVSVISAIVATYIIDRYPRRTLFTQGIRGITLSLLILGITFSYIDPNSSNEILKWVVFFGLALYVVSWSLSLSNVGSVILPEILPQSIRGIGMGVITALGWLLSLLTTVTFPSMLVDLGAANSFFIYAAIAASGFIFIKFYFPETKGLSLEKIEAQWREGVHPRNLGKS